MIICSCTHSLSFDDLEQRKVNAHRTMQHSMLSAILRLMLAANLYVSENSGCGERLKLSPKSCGVILSLPDNPARISWPASASAAVRVLSIET